jgi:hypothetical protein
MEGLAERCLTHSLKKASGSSKKRKKNKVETEEAAASGAAVSVKIKTGASDTRDGTMSKNGIKDAATASLTARVMAEQEEKAKRRKLESNDNLKTLFSSGDKGLRKNTDFMTRGFSIPANGKQ